MGNSLDLIKLLVSVASGVTPWSEVKKFDDDVWTHNPYMQVPKERQIHYPESDVDKVCSAMLGKYSNGGKYSGCVTYTPDDTQGLYANIHTSKKPGFTMDHEQKHAEGWVHPWPDFPKEWK